MKKINKKQIIAKNHYNNTLIRCYFSKISKHLANCKLSVINSENLNKQLALKRVYKMWSSRIRVKEDIQIKIATDFSNNCYLKKSLFQMKNVLKFNCRF